MAQKCKKCIFSFINKNFDFIVDLSVGLLIFLSILTALLWPFAFDVHILILSNLAQLIIAITQNSSQQFFFLGLAVLLTVNLPLGVGIELAFHE